MNQKQLSSLYRGILLLLAGGGTVALLSRVDQPWAKEATAIGSVILFLGGAAFIIFVTLAQSGLNAPVRDEPLPSSLYLHHWHRLARLAVAASVVLQVILVAVLL